MQILISYGQGPRASYNNVNDKSVISNYLYYMKMWFEFNCIVTRKAIIIILTSWKHNYDMRNI